MAGAMLAGLLAGGCAHQPATPPRASVESCIQFGIAAIQRHVTVSAVPQACQGLTRSQVNYAVGRAVYAMATTVRGKARWRVRAHELSPLLAQLVRAVPEHPSPPPVSASAASPASQPPFGVIALVTWLITIGFGSWMMVRWIRRGGLRQARSGTTGLSPSMIFAHFGLAVAGLLAWVAYLATGVTAVAWIACALLLPVTGLGVALVSLWLPERSGAAVRIRAVETVPAGGSAAPDPVSLEPPPARHPPALIVAAHGLFALATILFALLAAVGAG